MKRTVGELIEDLQEFPPDMPVHLTTSRGGVWREFMVEPDEDSDALVLEGDTQ